MQYWVQINIDSILGLYHISMGQSFIGPRYRAQIDIGSRSYRHGSLTWRRDNKTGFAILGTDQYWVNIGSVYDIGMDHIGMGQSHGDMGQHGQKATKQDLALLTVHRFFL